MEWKIYSTFHLMKWKMEWSGMEWKLERIFIFEVEWKGKKWNGNGMESRMEILQRC